jgi:hypothetical protein
MKPSERVRVAIESPYAGAVDENTKFAKRLCRYAYDQGKNPFAMHLFFPLFLKENKNEERTAGIECGIAWTQYADEVWFCLRPGEKLSPGMLKAVRRLSELARDKPRMRYMRFKKNGTFIKESSLDDFTPKVV